INIFILIIRVPVFKRQAHRRVNPLPPPGCPFGNHDGKRDQQYDDKSAHIRCKISDFFRESKTNRRKLNMPAYLSCKHKFIHHISGHQHTDRL
ncbi:MAG: hypothetical protein K2I35_00355, partial [Duncaniella sp.]|nr:hypothetical protein [Duncaniella sp.]